MKTFVWYCTVAAVWMLVPHAGLQSQQSESKNESALVDSRSLVAQFMHTYKSILLKTMSSGGATAAVSVCADTAQDIARDLSAVNGATLKRVSARWRNPANAPDRFEDSVLTLFAERHAAGTLDDRSEYFTIVYTDSGTSGRYMKPIVVQPVCLSCHGPEKSLSDDIRRTLKKHYPDDRAVGYAAGDLRGAVSVIIPFR